MINSNKHSYRGKYSKIFISRHLLESNAQARNLYLEGGQAIVKDIQNFLNFLCLNHICVIISPWQICYKNNITKIKKDQCVSLSPGREGSFWQFVIGRSFFTRRYSTFTLDLKRESAKSYASCMSQLTYPTVIISNNTTEAYTNAV